MKTTYVHKTNQLSHHMRGRASRKCLWRQNQGWGLWYETRGSSGRSQIVLPTARLKFRPQLCAYSPLNNFARQEARTRQGEEGIPYQRNGVELIETSHRLPLGQGQIGVFNLRMCDNLFALVGVRSAARYKIGLIKPCVRRNNSNYRNSILWSFHKNWNRTRFFNDIREGELFEIIGCVTEIRRNYRRNSSERTPQKPTENRQGAPFWPPLGMADSKPPTTPNRPTLIYCFHHVTLNSGEAAPIMIYAQLCEILRWLEMPTVRNRPKTTRTTHYFNPRYKYLRPDIFHCTEYTQTFRLY